MRAACVQFPVRLDGYDLDSYDLDGYDLDGYDLDGCDLDGYDLDGYDLDLASLLRTRRGLIPLLSHSALDPEKKAEQKRP